jgi:hypothetical protein
MQGFAAGHIRSEAAQENHTRTLTMRLMIGDPAVLLGKVKLMLHRGHDLGAQLRKLYSQVVDKATPHRQKTTQHNPQPGVS